MSFNEKIREKLEEIDPMVCCGTISYFFAISVPVPRAGQVIR